MSRLAKPVLKQMFFDVQEQVRNLMIGHVRYKVQDALFDLSSLWVNSLEIYENLRALVRR